MEFIRNGAEHVYTREEILLLRAEYSSLLPAHLYCPNYLTSHGKFSPDKYVECLWKDERGQKPIRVLRSDIPEILQNGSTLTPQRKNFKTGCKEESFAFPSSTRNLKQDKRGTTTNTWSKDHFSNKGSSSSTTNGYRFTTDYARRNAGTSGRRDSDRVEPMPEWMDDGPDSNTDIMQLGGFNEQEKRLEQSFQKLGLPDAATRQQQAEEEKHVLPVSDIEFAAKFGILDVSEIESEIFKDGIEEPKSSRMSRFFGSGKPKEGRETPKSPPQSESVLPAVARLLSAGSKSIGSLNDPPTNTSVMDFIKQTQSNTQAANTSNIPMDHTSAISQQHQMYNPTPINRLPTEKNDYSITQKQKKNIDLVPTSVMIQRSTFTKDEVASDVRAPKFSNPNTPSPITHHNEHEMIASSQHSNNSQWQSDNLQNYNDSNLNNPHGFANINCIPALARLGAHIFPIPNTIAFSADNKMISEAYRNGDYKTISGLQGRMNVQMQVFAALQHFRHDPSFVTITANDPQFERLLDSFVEQQQQLEGSLSDRFDEDLIECTNPPEHLTPPTALDQMMNIQSSSNDSNGLGNLSILNKLPATALTVEELERQILGNC